MALFDYTARALPQITRCVRIIAISIRFIPRVLRVGAGVWESQTTMLCRLKAILSVFMSPMLDTETEARAAMNPGRTIHILGHRTSSSSKTTRSLEMEWCRPAAPVTGNLERDL